MGLPSPHTIGVLGGTFDPIHRGHLTLAETALNLFDLDQILFIPAATSPHKRDRETTPSHHRLEMVRLAIKDQPRFAVSDIELRRGGVSYTIDTMETLQKEHPDSQIGLIMGIDTFQDLSSWRRYEDLLELIDLFVSSRPGNALPTAKSFIEEKLSQFPDSYTLTEEDENKITFVGAKNGRSITGFLIPPQPVSSSQIREGLQHNPSIKKMLPPDVEGYIMAHRLYSMHPHSLT